MHFRIAILFKYAHLHTICSQCVFVFMFVFVFLFLFVFVSVFFFSFIADWFSTLPNVTRWQIATPFYCSQQQSTIILHFILQSRITFHSTIYNYFSLSNLQLKFTLQLTITLNFVWNLQSQFNLQCIITVYFAI
jgi:hypothetical protein